MILYFLLDFMIYNNTNLYSFFVLNNLKNNDLWEVLITILLLYFLTDSLVGSLIIFCLYIINSYIKINKKLRFNLLINFLNYFIFIFLMSLYYKKNLAIILIKSLPINLIFWLLSYIINKKNIYNNG